MKRQMRQWTLRRLKQFDEMTYMERSARLVDRAMRTSYIQEAETIALTMSTFPEVHTWHFIEQLLALGKRVVVPRTLPSTREMDFRAITSLDDVALSTYDIYEPIVERTVAVRADEIDTIVVPGVVFARDGYRIGFGGGYYDRYLASYTGRTMALVFREQYVERVPTNEFDIPVQRLIVEGEEE